MHIKSLNHTYIFIFLIAFLTAIMNGCNTKGYRYISTQGVEQPDINLSDSIKTIAIAYKIPSFELQQDAFPVSRKKIAEEYLEGLYKRLSGSGGFDRVEVLTKPVIVHHSPDVFTPLRWEKIDLICSETRADALAVLEYFELYHIYQEDYTLNDQLQTQNKSLWRIYIPGSKTLADEYFFRDTTIFKGSSSRNQAAIDNLPGIHYAFSFSAYRSGLDYGTRITCYKSNIKRLIYTRVNNDFRRAFKHANAGEWKKAIGIWKEYAHHEDQSTSAKALYNISVAYESLGDIGKSLEMAKKSYQVQTIPRTYIHIDYLKKKHGGRI